MKGILLIAVVLVTSVQVDAAAVRLKTFREIFSSLEVATNIETKDPLILNLYEERKLTLPRTGKEEELNAVGISTLFGLSGHFCKKLVDADMKENPADRWAHNDVDFTLTAAQSLAPMVQNNILSIYGELFWQRSMDAEEMGYLTETMNSAIVILGALPNSTREVLIATCSVVSSSLSSIIVVKN